jgi:hypothetical protein
MIPRDLVVPIQHSGTVYQLVISKPQHLVVNALFSFQIAEKAALGRPAFLQCVLVLPWLIANGQLPIAAFLTALPFFVPRHRYRTKIP